MFDFDKVYDDCENQGSVIWDSCPPMNSLTLELVCEDMENRALEGCEEMKGWEKLTDEEVWEYYRTYYLPDEKALKYQELYKQLANKLVVIEYNDEEPDAVCQCAVLGSYLSAILETRGKNTYERECVYIKNGDVRAVTLASSRVNHYLYRMLRPGMDEKAFLDGTQGRTWQQIQDFLSLSTLPISELV